MMMMMILELQFQRHLQRHPPQIIFTTPGLEETISSWKRRLATHGLDVGAQERLTKFLYAYDLLVHAKSLAELVYMIESLCEEFALVGLQPNAAKTKIFRICTKKMPRFVDINGGLVHLLSDARRKHPGRIYAGDLTKRGHVGFQHRVQLAWAKFHPLEIVLTNNHFSIKLRLKLLDAVVTPTISFGLVPMPLTQRELIRLDALQTRMMTSIVGWVRMEAGGVPWRACEVQTSSRTTLSHSLPDHTIGKKTVWFCIKKMTQKMDGLKVFLHGVHKPTGKTFFWSNLDKRIADDSGGGNAKLQEFLSIGLGWKRRKVLGGLVHFFLQFLRRQLNC
jgi:hypothetical protein